MSALIYWFCRWWLEVPSVQSGLLGHSSFIDCRGGLDCVPFLGLLLFSLFDNELPDGEASFVSPTLPLSGCIIHCCALWLHSTTLHFAVISEAEWEFTKASNVFVFPWRENDWAVFATKEAG